MPIKKCDIEKLRSARSSIEAAKIIEALGVRVTPTMNTSLNLGYQVRGKQEAVFEQLIGSVVQETDDVLSGKHDDGVKVKKDKIEEAEKVPDKSGNDGSAQSSSINGLPKEGTDEPNSDIESMQTASGDDQMKEGFPGMMPGLEPGLQQQMMGGMAKLPPMNPAQQIQQTQYTVREALKPIIAELKGMKEAIRAQDAKYQEMQNSSISTLAVDVPPVQIRETQGIDTSAMPHKVVKPQLENRRNDLRTKNAHLHETHGVF